MLQVIVLNLSLDSSAPRFYLAITKIHSKVYDSLLNLSSFMNFDHIR